MKIPSLILAVLLISAPCVAQQNVVAKYRSKYPTPMTSAEKVELLKSVAAEVKGGILIKTTGNNCLGYSCDIVCFANGDHFDVLAAEEGAASPTWNFVGKIDPSRCELITSAPKPIPEPEPEPEPEVESVQSLLKLMLLVLDEVVENQQTQTEELKKAIQELKTQIANGVPIRFR